MTDREAREAFEAWVGKGLCLEQIPTGAPFAGDYRSIVMQTRWDAWQAATEAERERAALECPRWNNAHNAAAAIRALKGKT